MNERYLKKNQQLFSEEELQEPLFTKQMIKRMIISVAVLCFVALITSELMIHTGLYDKYVPQAKTWISQQLRQSIR